MEDVQLKSILEAALIAAGEPVTLSRLAQLFDEQERPSTKDLRRLLQEMMQDNEQRAFVLKELASGFCFQVKGEYAPWIAKLWEEKPPRYSRAFLETLAIIAYRQPITRAEIENIRGVAVSSHIIKVLSEREWVQLIGHRDVPGRPGIYGTTKEFLDYFNLKSLSDLPSLQEIKDLNSVAEKLEAQLDLALPEDAQQADEEAVAEVIELEVAQEVEEIELEPEQEIAEEAELVEEVEQASELAQEAEIADLVELVEEELAAAGTDAVDDDNDE